MEIDGEMIINDMPVGHKQFTEIARELSKDQLKLLILDEPTAVLTEHEAAALLDSIRGMASRGIAVIFITHRLQEILSVCDKVAVMRDGCLVQNVNAKDTSVQEITRWMVGRNVSSGENGAPADHQSKRDHVHPQAVGGHARRNRARRQSGRVRGRDPGHRRPGGPGQAGHSQRRHGPVRSGREGDLQGPGDRPERPAPLPGRLLAFVSEHRRGVGLLLDESLEWNIAFPAMQIQNKFLKSYLGGLIKWRDEKAIRDVTEKYIDELAIKCTSSRQNAKELSGGNQQKVCLAKAFALEPQFLFVSEPTRGIDVGAKSLVLNALKKFNQESGVTIVMISSELEELRQVCDRIAIVSGGRIAGILPASDSSEDFGMLMVSQVK